MQGEIKCKKIFFIVIVQYIVFQKSLGEKRVSGLMQQEEEVCSHNCTDEGRNNQPRVFPKQLLIRSQGP